MHHKIVEAQAGKTLLHQFTVRSVEAKVVKTVQSLTDAITICVFATKELVTAIQGAQVALYRQSAVHSWVLARQVGLVEIVSVRHVRRSHCVIPLGS
jgi:hypothetical protein